MNLDSEKLKSLTKDKEAYNELSDLISAESDRSNYLPSNMSGFFWIRKIRQPRKIEVSKSVKEILGFSSAEIAEKPGGIFSLIHEDDIAIIKKRMGEFETDPTASTMAHEFRVICKDGETKWIKENVTVERDGHGRITKQFSISCDVTSLKTNENQYQKKIENLREINRTKDRFISIVSHDLRSPFTSLLGFSEILLNEKELPEEEKNEYLNYIYDASKNQLQLINYLLEWARLQTGRIQMEPRRLQLKMVVSNCISSLIGNAIRKDIELKHEIDNDVFIHADERLITQAITNLISNAIKFTPKYKSVTVTASKFKTGIIEVVVKDEGVGISEENQDKLFRIDQKFSLQGTEGEKGTGLGLTLVKEIVERHKGEIWFYSKVDEGTEFHITLQEAKNIILLVEDDPSLISLYKKAIEKNVKDFEIVQSVNGYEAMSIIMNSLPTVLITDHDMPLMNGVQLVEAVRKRDKNYSIPILVISAKLDEELIDKYESLGVTEIINKPVNIDNLVKKVTQMVK